MIDIKTKDLVINYTLRGVLFGAGLLFVLFFADMIAEGFYFSSSYLVQNHIQNPYIFIIDLFPIIFGLVGFVIGKVTKKQINKYQNELAEQNKKEELVLEFLETLKKGEGEKIENKNLIEDRIGKSLMQLQQDILKNKEEEKQRRNEDKQRHWITEGLAKFGEILRHNNDDIEELSNDILVNLVNYIKANQGAFYLVNDDKKSDIHLEMTACYAWKKKKYIEKRIEIGADLVGQTYIDQKLTFIKEVPEDYIEITSGLGKSLPRCITLIPLQVNEEVHGIIELASFDVFQPFELSFLEQLSESIATTISSVKINLRTAKLLKETQKQAEIMAAQEEVMRNNMEELEKAKEEAAEQGELLTNFTNSVNHTLIRAEYDTNGILLYANTRFLKKLGYENSREIIGKHISIFIHPKDKEWFFKIWDGLAHGGKHFEGDMKHVTKQGKDFWSMATYTCVRKQEGGVEKILFLGIDTTDQKKLNLDFEGQIKALNNATIKAEYTKEGVLINANQNFLDMLGMDINEMQGETVFKNIPNDQTKDFQSNWEGVLNGKAYKGQFRRKAKDDSFKWLYGTISAVNNMYGEVDKVIFIATDITDQKKMEKEIEMVKIRHEETLEGMLDAILIIDENGIIDFFNKAAEELWKLTKDRIIGKSIKQLFPQKVTGDHDIFMQKYVVESVGVRKEVVIETSNGEEVPVLLLFSKAKIGGVISYTAFIQNIEVELF